MHLPKDSYAHTATMTAESTEAKDTPAVPPNEEDDENSDVEMEGMDLEGDDDVDANEDDDDGMAEGDTSTADDDEAVNKREHEDHDELEAARKERMELMASEANNVEAPAAEGGTIGGKANIEEQLQYLLSQSEVFAHFLAGRFE